jgi:hypothetical protein
MDMYDINALCREIAEETLSEYEPDMIENIVRDALEIEYNEYLEIYRDRAFGLDMDADLEQYDQYPR